MTSEPGTERFLGLDRDDDPHLRELDGERIDGVEEVGPSYFVEVDGERVLVAEHEIVEKSVETDGGTQKQEDSRFAESTNLKYGVVEERIPEEDVHRHDENPVFVSQFREGGEYRLHVGSRVGMDTEILFDEVDCDDSGDTLRFRKRLDGGETVRTGALDFYVLDAGHYYGLVGEWLLEQLDLSEYRTEAECPECGSAVLTFTETSGCESPDCDFWIEGRVIQTESLPECAHCGDPVPESEAVPGPAGWAVHEECDADD